MTHSPHLPTRRAHATLRGFTLVELVVTILIVGILSAYSIPRMFDTQPYAERGYLDELASVLRHAQRVAIASRCQVQVQVDSLAGYVANQRTALLNTCNPAGAWTQAVRRGDGTTLTGTPPNNVTLTPAGVTTYVFNADGTLAGPAPPTLTINGLTLSVDRSSGVVTVTP